MKKCINPRGKPWTREESRLVATQYGPLTAKQLGERMGRSEESVRSHLKQLALGRGPQ